MKEDSGRLINLMDGIFAVALTLLALDLKVSGNLEYDQMAQELALRWRELLAYFLSFYVLSRYWMGNVSRFSEVKFVDQTFMFLSLGSLAFVALVPAATALLSDYPNSRISVCMYGSIMAMIGLMDMLAFLYASGGSGLFSEAIRVQRGFWIVYRGMLPGISILTIIIGIWEPELAIYTYFILAIVLEFVLRGLKKRIVSGAAG